MAPKNQMAREIEELKEALEREKRERRELEATMEREDRQKRRERLQLIARIEALEKEREQPRMEKNNENLEAHNEGGEHEETRRDEEDPEERRLVRLLKVVQGGGIKGHIDLPIYQGRMDSEEVLGWIEALENYFELEDTNDDKKVRFAEAKLRGTALTWWSGVQVDRITRGLNKITSWERMKSMMKEQFLPSDFAIQTKRMRQNFKQRDMDVMTYTEQFHKLSIRGGVEDEDEKVARYLNGLRYNLQDEIGLNVPQTLGDCFQLAIRAKEKLKRKQERQGGTRGRGSMRGRGGRSANESQGQDNKDKESTSEQRGGYSYRGGGRFGSGRGSHVFIGRCYHCNEVGHPSFKCPKWDEADRGKDRRVHLTCEEEDKKEDKEPLKAYPITEGDFLMIRRGKLQQQTSNQVSIFRTQCLSKGKICKLIIDSSSHDNLVSFDMVSKLGLQTFDHPNPYNATWVSQEQHIMISHRAYVDFSIGPYHDQVLCDVIPMTCGHIILGRPWQYLRRTIHDGYTNTYLVHKGSKRYCLTPSPCREKYEHNVICFGDKIRLCEQGKEDNDTSWKNKTKLQQNNNLKEQHGCSFNSIRVGGIDYPVNEKRDVVKPLSLQMISN
ncbi:uncharacterized protein LOC131858838 [Cryptomeria japonica]|uniref:uncharacterized protein LOC131858838 n=1 Tax=Cryptomeria japonica TaxID=3369 RepID=UPI0027DA60A4|nr:uncharacterized protein LOC131858838 [Cryptomeria japonica]